MIFFILTIISCIANASENGILQYKIILSNTKGIPFSIEDGDYAIWGFEVDADENFWFLGGDPAKLVKMTKRGDIVFKQEYKEFKANPIGIKSQKLYLFDIDFYRDPPNKLFVISCDDGQILQNFPIYLKKRVNWHVFLDNGIIFELSFAKPPYDNVKDMYKYYLYSYEGKFIGEVYNRIGLNELYYFLKFRFDYHYIGKYKNNPLFANYCLENVQWEIFTINIRGQITQKIIVDQNMLGEPFYQAPEDLWCLANNKLFIVYRKDKSAIITELDLNKLLEGAATKAPVKTGVR